MIYAENIFLCITAPLLLSLFFLRKNAKRFVVFFLTGMGICLLSAYISGFSLRLAGLEEGETATFISPLVEEMQKLLPLLLFLFLYEPTDEAFLDAAIGIGIGFATFENCCYILSAGAESLPYILIRGLAVGVMHLVTTLAVSLALIMARRIRMLSIPGIAGSLTLSMIFHALYNLLVSQSGISSMIGYALPLLAAAGLYAACRSELRKKSE